MKAIANANGADFVEVVHPNPYHAKKKLTESEQAVLSLPEKDNFRRGSTAGYGLLERHADVLKSRGITSAAHLFDNVRETIYSDSAGHLSQLGETMLTRFAASQVAVRLADPVAARRANNQVS